MRVLRSKHEQHKDSSGSQGFSLLEVMIAMVILMVGLLGLLALFGTALSTTAHAQEDLIAKQKARELLEAVYSSRDDADITWAQIQNDNVVGAGGIFKTGWQPLLRLNTSSTQILGTNAQTVNGVTFFGEGPTPDYVLAPDPATGNLTVQVQLTNYLRRIDILPVLNPDGSTNPNLRSISVTVRVLGRINRDYTVAGYISSYR